MRLASLFVFQQLLKRLSPGEGQSMEYASAVITHRRLQQLAPLIALNRTAPALSL
jgi:hypothetical protein